MSCISHYTLAIFIDCANCDFSLTEIKDRLTYSIATASHGSTCRGFYSFIYVNEEIACLTLLVASNFIRIGLFAGCEQWTNAIIINTYSIKAIRFTGYLCFVSTTIGFGHALGSIGHACRFVRLTRCCIVFRVVSTILNSASLGACCLT